LHRSVMHLGGLTLFTCGSRHYGAIPLG
jgi:hypothetical protein